MPAMALGAGWSPSSGNAGWDDLRKQVSIANMHFDVIFTNIALHTQVLLFVSKSVCLGSSVLSQLR